MCGTWHQSSAKDANCFFQAGKDHIDGKFDEWKIIARDEYWGKPDTAKTETEDEKSGEEKKEAVNRSQDLKEVKDSDDGESEL